MLVPEINDKGFVRKIRMSLCYGVHMLCSLFTKSTNVSSTVHFQSKLLMKNLV